MRESIVSFYQGPVRNKIPCCTCSIAAIHQYITSDPSLKAVTEQVRSEVTNRDVFKLKKLTLLPYVTPGGVFSRCCTSGLLVPSGDFVVDIDGLSSTEEAISLRDRLAGDDLLQPDLVFVSPGCHGVKLFLPYRIQPDEPLGVCFTHAIQASWTYLESIYGLQPDRANTDLCRGCLLCHDAGAKQYQPVHNHKEINT
ncbi:VirE [gut metagenome]|uniref:VirE n=1 Tax=gut metagenome TaxID=749906 RepID=J9D5U6_9ZZZZ